MAASTVCDLSPIPERATVASFSTVLANSAQPEPPFAETLLGEKEKIKWGLLKTGGAPKTGETGESETLQGRRYLKSALGRVLASCMAELCESRPLDPIEFTARWLYRYADSRVYIQDKSDFVGRAATAMELISRDRKLRLSRVRAAYNTFRELRKNLLEMSPSTYRATFEKRETLGFGTGLETGAEGAVGDGAGVGGGSGSRILSYPGLQQQHWGHGSADSLDNLLVNMGLASAPPKKMSLSADDRARISKLYSMQGSRMRIGGSSPGSLRVSMFTDESSKSHPSDSGRRKSGSQKKRSSSRRERGSRGEDVEGDSSDYSSSPSEDDQQSEASLANDKMPQGLDAKERRKRQLENAFRKSQMGPQSRNQKHQQDHHQQQQRQQQKQEQQQQQQQQKQQQRQSLYGAAYWKYEQPPGRIVCVHPVLGKMAATPPSKPWPSLEAWFAGELTCQSLYEHEIYACLPEAMLYVTPEHDELTPEELEKQQQQQQQQQHLNRKQEEQQGEEAGHEGQHREKAARKSSTKKEPVDGETPRDGEETSSPTLEGTEKCEEDGEEDGEDDDDDDDVRWRTCTAETACEGWKLCEGFRKDDDDVGGDN